MKILLVRNDNFGDLICTTPAIEALRKKYPDAKIDIVVNTYNFLAIRNNPFVDTIYVYTKPKHEKNWLKKAKAFFGKLEMIGKIFREGYDVAVVFRGGYSPYAEQFSTVSRAKMRIGVKDPNGKDHFTHHVDPCGSMHEVEFCFKCLEPLEVRYNGENLYFYLEDEFVERYQSFNINLLFHISARKPENRFSFEKWKALFSELKKRGYLFHFTSSPDDWKMAEELQRETGAEFLKTLDLLELAGVIKNAKLFVTLDGGTVHLAPALGVKTIALFGSGSVERWHPWGYKDLVLQHPSKIAENIPNEEIIAHVIRHLEA